MFLQDIDRFNGPPDEIVSFFIRPCNLFIMYFYYVYYEREVTY